MSIALEANAFSNETPTAKGNGAITLRGLAHWTMH
jgi:hypothetical protein